MGAFKLFQDDFSVGPCGPTGQPDQPDPSAFTFKRTKQVGLHLVALVQYPNCTAYEGRKVVVFYCCDIKTARKWKRLDPHFSDPKRHDPSDVEVAPPPDGRFPATDQGWSDAVMLARLKQ